MTCPNCNAPLNPDRLPLMCRSCGWRDPDHPMYRNTDPDTSVDAGESHRPTAASHRKQIRDYIEAGHDGQTRDEIARGVGLDPWSVSKRLPELVREGIIQASEAITRPGTSGKHQRTWWIVQRADQSRLF